MHIQKLEEIVIPVKVSQDRNLSHSDKLLYGVLYTLCKSSVTGNYMVRWIDVSKICGCNAGHIKDCAEKLEKLGYIVIRPYGAKKSISIV